MVLEVRATPKHGCTIDWGWKNDDTKDGDEVTITLQNARGGSVYNVWAEGEKIDSAGETEYTVTISGSGATEDSKVEVEKFCAHYNAQGLPHIGVVFYEYYMGVDGLYMWLECNRPWDAQ